MLFVKRFVFNLLAGVSLMLFVAICAEEILKFSEDDFSFYWASNGNMISVDSFEDTLDANAITLRIFSPAPADVPFHFVQCSVETGSEIPSLGVGRSVDVSLNQGGQPVGRNDAGKFTKAMNVTALLQISLKHAGAMFLLAVLTMTLWTVVKYREWKSNRIGPAVRLP